MRVGKSNFAFYESNMKFQHIPMKVNVIRYRHLLIEEPNEEWIPSEYCSH